MGQSQYHQAPVLPAESTQSLIPLFRLLNHSDIKMRFREPLEQNLSVDRAQEVMIYLTHSVLQSLYITSTRHTRSLT